MVTKQLKKNIPFWFILLPGFLKKRISDREKLKEIIDNIVWLVFDKMLRMTVGLFVGVWVARYLGPKDFGILNYALAVVGVFSAVASLGLDQIVVLNLVREPHAKDIILGTSFVLKFIGGILAYGLAIVAVAVCRPADKLMLIIVVIIASQLIFKASEAIKFWFDSQVRSKFSVIAENSAFVIVSAANVFLMLNHARLKSFAWTSMMQIILSGIAMVSMYHFAGGTVVKWKFNYKLAVQLLKDSWPLMLSAIAVIIYMRIDQIMLGQMMDNDAVGIYSAAVRISEIWYFVPMAIVSSTFPAILHAKATNNGLYYARLQKLFNLMAFLSIAISVVISFSSKYIIFMLYGNGYAASADVLTLSIWAGIFVSLGIASGSWLMAENLQKISFYQTLAGAIANVVLNFILIPPYGINGAAAATVVSYGIATFMLLFIKQSRRVGIMLLRSLLFRNFKI